MAIGIVSMHTRHRVDAHTASCRCTHAGDLLNESSSQQYIAPRKHLLTPAAWLADPSELPSQDNMPSSVSRVPQHGLLVHPSCLHQLDRCIDRIELAGEPSFKANNSIKIIILIVLGFLLHALLLWIINSIEYGLLA